MAVHICKLPNRLLFLFATSSLIICELSYKYLATSSACALIIGTVYSFGASTPPGYFE